MWATILATYDAVSNTFWCGCFGGILSRCRLGFSRVSGSCCRKRKKSTNSLDVRQDLKRVRKAVGNNNSSSSSSSSSNRSSGVDETMMEVEVVDDDDDDDDL